MLIIKNKCQILDHFKDTWNMKDNITKSLWKEKDNTTK